MAVLVVSEHAVCRHKCGEALPRRRGVEPGGVTTQRLGFYLHRRRDVRAPQEVPVRRPAGTGGRRVMFFVSLF
jgi:hypothetical protein